MTDAQRAVFLPRAARGEFLGAAAMSEPDVGSDLGNIACRARKDGDGWVINGNKYWCTFADGADYIMLVARTSDAPDPKRKHVGLSSFLIEKPRGTLPAGREGRADSQDRLFRLEDLGARLRQLPPAGRGADRRGRPRVLLHLRRAGAGARPHRRARDRPGARRARGRDGLCPGAAAVRPGDRRVPEHALPARAHGDRDRGRRAS